jgi:predicted metal-dependent hydrolase
MSFLEQYERGIAEFNDGRYFECHDTLEELWMDERGERRRFLQGLIQGAVGLFHATGGNLTGANSQLTKSLEKLEGFSDQFLGVDLGTLREELREVRARIRNAIAMGTDRFDCESLPTIRYAFDPGTMTDLLEHDTV